MGEVDPAFIQEPDHRPKLSLIEAEGIPIINLSPIINKTVEAPSAIEGLVKEIGSACKEWGFFQVINHGVPLRLRQKIEEASRKFFAQSLEDKKKVSRNETISNGYHDTEHTKNVRDWKEVFDYLVKDPTFLPATPDDHDDQVNQWTNQSPQYPPNFRVIIQEYIQEVEKLADKLLELIALGLGLEAKRHKDPGALTILAQDEVGGLEVKRKADQEWIGVKPTPDAYIINVGDIIQVWSNDAYESVEHRVVVTSEKERFSIPFFFYPEYGWKLRPLSSSPIGSDETTTKVESSTPKSNTCFQHSLCAICHSIPLSSPHPSSPSSSTPSSAERTPLQLIQSSRANQEAPLD